MYFWIIQTFPFFFFMRVTSFLFTPLTIVIWLYMVNILCLYACLSYDTLYKNPSSLNQKDYFRSIHHSTNLFPGWNQLFGISHQRYQFREQKITKWERRSAQSNERSRNTLPEFVEEICEWAPKRKGGYIIMIRRRAYFTIHGHKSCDNSNTRKLELHGTLNVFHQLSFTLFRLKLIAFFWSVKVKESECLFFCDVFGSNIWTWWGCFD